MGIAQVFLGWAKAARRQARAQASPWQENTLLRNGPELRETAVVQADSFPGLGRMFMARPHRRALAFLGFWVRQLLAAHRELARWSISLHYRIASLQGWIAGIGETLMVPGGDRAAALWCSLWPLSGPARCAATRRAPRPNVRPVQEHSRMRQHGPALDCRAKG